MAQLPFPLSFQRQFAGALNADFTFATTAERTAYLSSARCYPGQMVFDEETGKPYWVNGDKTAYLELPEALTSTYYQPYHFQFYNDLDTASAEITLFGPKEFVNPQYSPKLSGVTYEVKLSSSDSYTARTDLTALNAWITANVATANTAYDLRLIANYGGSTGAASATIYETKTLSAT